jgi:Caenorhabditis protein of unknown function, DUF268
MRPKPVKLIVQAGANAFEERSAITHWSAAIAVAILFNNARIYGGHRLPALLAGWEVLDTFGFHVDDIDGDGIIAYRTMITICFSGPTKKEGPRRDTA